MRKDFFKLDRVDQLIRLITLEIVQAVRNGERITAGQLQLLKELHSGTFCIPLKYLVDNLESS